MDPFSISVGTLTIIETCLKSGKVLIKLYEDYQSAEADISGTLLKLKTTWDKTETQMAFLKRIWDTTDANFQTNHLLLLSVLESKLQEAINLLDGVIGSKVEPSGLSGLLTKRGTMRKGKFVLTVKDCLEKTLAELMEWRSLFDLSWYLLARIANKDLDQCLESGNNEGPLKLLTGLRKSVRDLNSDAMQGPARPISSRDFVGTRRVISSSSMFIAPIEGRIQEGIVDTMVVNPSMDAEGTTRSVMAISKALSRMDPSTFGLLRCCGVINKTDKYEFVFEVPQELSSVKTPKTLRDLLTEFQPSLNVRLELAKQLAKSVLYLHAAGFVHKNIRPETILVFDPPGGSKTLFLCGFENFRAVKDDTFKVGDDLPERNLYRHPLRQGIDPERRYVMQHDIYSLGVVLFEIGIWWSFLRREGESSVIVFKPQESIRDSRHMAFAIKQQILAHMKDSLPRCIGEKYMAIVERCLTCLDDDASWHQADDQSTPEIEVGIKFIEDVLVQLHEIVV